MNFLAQSRGDIDHGRVAGDQCLAVGDHVVRHPLAEVARLRGVALHFPGGPHRVLVGMKLEDQRAAIRDTARVFDELAAVLVLERLPHIRGRDQHVVTVREIVVPIGLAMVEVRYAGDTNLFPTGALRHEKIPVTLRRDAKNVVKVGQAGRRGLGHPPRQSQSPNQVIHDVFGIGHAFLNQHQTRAAHPSGNDQVTAGDDQIVWAVEALVVQRHALFLQELEGAPLKPPTQHREIQRTGPLDPATRSVTEIGGEEAVQLREMPSDLVHHLGLIQRSADEQRLHRSSVAPNSSRHYACRMRQCCEDPASL